MLNFQAATGEEIPDQIMVTTRQQGWKFMSCSHCKELGQQASWLLIGCKKVDN